jgi:hypothetical protein
MRRGKNRTIESRFMFVQGAKMILGGGGVRKSFPCFLLGFCSIYIGDWGIVTWNLFHWRELALSEGSTQRSECQPCFPDRDF